MKEQEVSIEKEIQSAPQPVVFMSQSTGKVALAVLSVVATGLAVSASKAAMATENQSTAQPVVFRSQPTPLKIVTGEKLQQYENHLSERLGIDGVNMMKRSGGCSSGTSSSEAASDCDD